MIDIEFRYITYGNRSAKDLQYRKLTSRSKGWSKWKYVTEIQDFIAKREINK